VEDNGHASSPITPSETAVPFLPGCAPSPGIHNQGENTTVGELLIQHVINGAQPLLAGSLSLSLFHLAVSSDSCLPLLLAVSLLSLSLSRLSLGSLVSVPCPLARFSSLSAALSLFLLRASYLSFSRLLQSLWSVALNDGSKMGDGLMRWIIRG
jgi:hypothetical protein